MDVGGGYFKPAKAEWRRYIRYHWVVFTTQLRKVGNSWVVTIPREEMEKLGITDGATVVVEVREARVIVEPVIPADLRDAVERALKKTRRGLEYLA